ncbi:MAG: single-stranded DNA-binding protein [Candidatus Gastranaerophilales bacterium]|nr:single-stranded DNA-binding protein [Candidatus Gastranaerophilales bacterium]
MNSVVIVGRAGRDAEIKYYESGKSRATFSLAVNRWDSKTSAEVTDWFNVEIWEKQAEFASNYLKKGRLAVIEGRIRVNNWTDQSGENRQSYIVTAANIRLLDSKRDIEQ